MHPLGLLEEHRKILGLSPAFGKQDLKAAYYASMREWHPDRFYGQPQQLQDHATERTKAINVAYEFLSEHLEANAGFYRAFADDKTEANEAWSRYGYSPNRAYQGRRYTAGFADEGLIEVFLKSSHIISAAYDRKKRVLYIKFSRNVVYRYFDVPEEVFNSFFSAESHGRFAARNIYKTYQSEKC